MLNNQQNTILFTATSGSTNIVVSQVTGSTNAYYIDQFELAEDHLYEATLKMSSDYYPFGMQMPGRSTNGDKYRFGYNGMEKDSEMKGEGNSYTTEFRQYDPRLGRWLSLDPLASKYPNMSPYCAFNNNPIYFTDPLGLEGDPPNVHYYNMVKGKDGNYHPVYDHSSGTLIVKANARKINTETNSNTPIPDGNYGSQTARTNVYTYWNKNGTIKRQTVASRKKLGIAHHYADIASVGDGALSANIGGGVEVDSDNADLTDYEGTGMNVAYLEDTPNDNGEEVFVVWATDPNNFERSYTYNTYFEMLKNTDGGCCPNNHGPFENAALSDITTLAEEGGLEGTSFPMPSSKDLPMPIQRKGGETKGKTKVTPQKTDNSSKTPSPGRKQSDWDRFRTKNKGKGWSSEEFQRKYKEYKLKKK